MSSRRLLSLFDALMSWLSCAFEFDEDLHEKNTLAKKSKGKKRLKDVSSAKYRSDAVNTGSELWLDRHHPSAPSDLAVHKKKIQEVQDWLKHAFQTSSNMVRVLLVTGPPGCGKSATLRVLSKELGFDIKEWINPVLEAYDQTSMVARRWGDAPYQESQVRMFGSFLRDANRYCGVVGTTDVSKQIILVEELPNVFHYDTSKLHNVLRSLSARGLCPIVFILSDSTHKESNTSQLFPKQLVSELGINTISFNPIAHTSLVKALTKIVAVESKSPSGSGQFCPPTKELLESLATGSGGDIRSAINSLQFACTKRGQPGGGRVVTKTQKKLGKRSHSSSSMLEFLSLADEKGQQEVERLSAVLGTRDHSLFLFRALGKVLYCKRHPRVSTSHNITSSQITTSTFMQSTNEDSFPLTLPPHLSHCERNPLAFNPEEVIENTHMSGEMFALYLHQNYVDFFTSCDDLSLASGYFSDSDLLQKIEWNLNNTSKLSSKSVLSASVASRGVMYSNTSNMSAGKHSWRPLHKPEWNDVNRKYLSYSRVLREVFVDESRRGCTHSPVVLQTELIPYMAVINCPLKSSAQVNVIQTVTTFSRKSIYRVRSHSERLDEREVQLQTITEEPDYDLLSLSLSQPQQQQQHQQQQHAEEVLVEANGIETFSDDDEW